jgi:transmembrane sensor
MSEPLLGKTDLIPPERLAEAGVWVARLHSGEPGKAAMIGVKQWLKAHPANVRALELCTEIWEESANLRRITPFAAQIAIPPRQRSLVRMAAAAMALLLVSAALFLWLTPTGDLTTEVGEQRLVTLTDGTRVFLNTATRVAVKYGSTVRLVELKSGEALFEVAKKPTWPFIVKAGDRRIKALGTSFVVRRDATQTAVTLVEGTVSVTRETPPPHAPAMQAGSPPAPDAFTLTPGQRLTFLAGHARLDTTPLDKAVAWRRGEIIFEDTPLADAASELNRYSKEKLVIEQQQALALRVTGLFQTGDSLSFAHAVAQSYGLAVEERSDAIVIAGAPVRHSLARP